MSSSSQLALLFAAQLPLAMGCATGPAPSRLALGGTHDLGDPSVCHLTQMAPEGALVDLKWHDALVVLAATEGTAEVACGAQTRSVQVVAPAQMTLTLEDGAPRPGAAEERRVTATVHVFDAQARELELGKDTEIDWTSSPDLAVDNDPSAGEFGLCDTCYGVRHFRVVGPGQGKIEARFGSLSAGVTVPAKP